MKGLPQGVHCLIQIKLNTATLLKYWMGKKIHSVFFHEMLWKNPNKLFWELNNSELTNLHRQEERPPKPKQSSTWVKRYSSIISSEEQP